MRDYKIKYLSYKLGAKVPVHGNKEASLEISREKSLGKKDSCNTFRFSMQNHWGTHIDAPAHFFKGAKKISDYPAGNWLFKEPCVIELPLQKGRAIRLDEVRTEIKKCHDLVLLKTGFGRCRGSRSYSFKGPSVSPEVGLWLRSERPNIRAIGFDFISVGSYQDREEGRRTHRVFLDPGRKGFPILIIEDMKLSYDLSGLKMAWVAPLLIDRIDSSPCTVFGVFD